MARNFKKKKKIDFKDNLKEYFSIVSKHKTLFVLMILTVIVAESLFVADKFLYKWLIDSAENFISGELAENLFVKTTLIIASIFLMVVIFRSIFKLINMRLISKFEPVIQKEVKEKYFNHILRLHYGFHTSHKTGSLISKLGRGQNAIEGLTDVFVFQIGPLILQFIMVSVSMAVFSLKSALILSGIVLAFIGYSLYINKIQIKTKVKMNKAIDKERGYIADVLTNVETVKYYGKEKNINSKLSGIMERTRSLTTKYYQYYSSLEFGQTLILGIGTAAILFFPFKEFLDGNLTLGTLVFIYSIYGNVAGNLFRFVWGIRNYYRSMADMQDLFEYGKINNEIKDSLKAKSIDIKNGSIEFKNVNFTYPEKRENGKEIFKNFNLKIKPNEKIALVGHSGSGKTTIVKLINRFYDVDSGEILVDNMNIKDIKQESLRGETGIVPQEAILFDETIYNNLKFVKPNATKEEIMEAVKLAQLDKIIKKFPKGMNTIVGERGVKLSGGEKQRVSIARAILANKKILILDEATSALDSQTEHDIQKALDKLLEGRTSIIIAHRLSTIMKADRIIVMSEGKIVEEGSHNELLKKKGKYYKLWKMQSGGYIQD